MKKKNIARLTESLKNESVVYTKNDVEIIDIIYSLSGDEEKWPELLIALGQCSASLGNERQSDMLDEEQQLEQKLLPHFERSIRIVYKKMNLEKRVEHFSQLVNQLPYGFLCVDAQNNLLIVNHAAEILLNHSEAFTDQDGRLQFLPAKLVDAFRQYHSFAIDSIVPVSEALNVEYHCEKTATKYFFHIYCIQFEPIQFAIEIYESQLQLPYFSDVLKSHFRLSKTELEVALSLMEGNSAQEIAEQRHISKVTVKTHIRKIYRKTNSNSQVDFIHNMTLKKLRELKKRNGEGNQREGKESAKTICLDNGNQVSYGEYGPSNGYPIIYCHNIFGSRRQVLPFDKVLQNAGLRIIVPERPGYGYSTFSPNRTALNWVEDLDEFIQHLQIKRYSILGFGAGARYATASAARATNKPERLVLVSPLPEITERNVSDMPGIVRHSSNLVRFSHRISLMILDYVFKRGPYEYYQRLLAESPDIDTLLSQIPDLYGVLIESWQDATSQGSKTILKEIEIYSNPWEFDLNEIECPTTLWHGSLDVTVPPRSISDMAASIKHCDHKLVAEETHWIFYRRWGEILSVLGESIATASSEVS